jgi:hypothetical protein
MSRCSGKILTIEEESTQVPIFVVADEVVAVGMAKEGMSWREGRR